MKNDIFKYITILIVIIGLIWWLLYKDNNASQSQNEKIDIQGVYSN